MKLLVFGGRKYDCRAVAFAALDHLHARIGIDQIIHGNASGADKLADQWAESRGVSFKRYPAAWRAIKLAGAVIRKDRRGLAYNVLAGHWRNQQMIEAEPDAGLQFPGGTGTADMRRRLDAAGIPVIQVYQRAHGPAMALWPMEEWG